MATRSRRKKTGAGAATSLEDSFDAAIGDGLAPMASALSAAAAPNHYVQDIVPTRTGYCPHERE